MLSKPFIMLTASLVIATSGLASARLITTPARVMQPAQTFAQPNHKKSAVKAGVVGSDGSIIAGSGFSVSHDGTGEYTLDVSAGYFKNCPVVMVTPAGVDGHAPIPNDYDYYTCGNNGEVKIQIRIYSATDGSLQDNSFQFVMNEIQ